MLANLAILLASDSVEGDGEDVIFDSADEIMSILQDKGEESTPIISSTERERQANDPVIVVWHDKKDNPEWYVGFYLDDNDDGTVLVDHLERFVMKDERGRRVKSENQWMRLKIDDIQDVEEEQILSCTPIGDWKLASDTFVYELDNSEEIKTHFLNAYF